MAEELLKLENIYKNFGNVKVLKDVNIKINKGEVVATTSPLFILMFTSFKTFTFPKFL